MAMEKIFGLLVCALAFFVLLVQANDEGFTNYADIIKLNYIDETWQCDMIVCPENTYSCVIVYENSLEYRYAILRINICNLENGTTFSKTKLSEMDFDQTVRINVTSHLNADSVYTVDFSLSHQSIQGTVAPNGWSEVQSLMNERINSVIATS